MRARQTLPNLWLISDERNDAQLERALKRLPRRSGFIYRHYHLAPDQRRARFEKLARIARARGHAIIVAGEGYGPPSSSQRKLGSLKVRVPPAFKRSQLSPGRRAFLATAHTLREIGAANRAGADAVLLSPVFPTRSHPDGKTLGPTRFRLLARSSKAPVIALGGMIRHRARALQWPRWAAIDGLS
jgi:thiamine-phosphate pyrophosphorylase